MRRSRCEPTHLQVDARCLLCIERPQASILNTNPDIITWKTHAHLATSRSHRAHEQRLTSRVVSMANLGGGGEGGVTHRPLSWQPCRSGSSRVCVCGGVFQPWDLVALSSSAPLTASPWRSSLSQDQESLSSLAKSRPLVIKHNSLLYFNGSHRKVIIEKGPPQLNGSQSVISPSCRHV